MNKLLFIHVFAILSQRMISQIIPNHEERLMHSYDSTVMVQLDNIESVQKRPFQNSDITLSTAIAGGGYRATFFALGVMLELENIKIPHKNNKTGYLDDTLLNFKYPNLSKSSNLLNEIDYFSTVSGGGFAVGLYLGGFRSIELQEDPRASIIEKNHFTFDIPNPDSLFKKIKNKDLSSASLFKDFDKWFLLRSGPILRQTFKYTYTYYDENSFYIAKKNGRTTNFAPKLYKGNTGTLIKHLITKPGICTETRFRKYFLFDEFINSNILFPKKGSQVRLPFLVANATIVGNVLPFRFTPNIFENFRVRGNFFTLEFALIASASFPGFFANQSLKCNIGVGKEPSYIHLMDGGVFDNSGVRTAIELLNLEKTPTKYLLLIDARGADIPSSYALLSQDFNLTSIVDLVTDLQYLLVGSFVNQFRFKNIVLNLKSILSESDKNAPFYNRYKYRFKDMADTLIKKFEYDKGVYSDTLVDKLLYAYSHEGHIDHSNSKDNLRYIYEICSNIKTNLYLEEWEKRILLLAGKIAVRKNIDTIKIRFSDFW